MSDPIGPGYALDDRVDDLCSVLDAEGVERTFLHGVAEGGPTSIAFAAKYPERVRGIILNNTCARLVSGDGYPHGSSRQQWEALIDNWAAQWGTPNSPTIELLAPGRASDPELIAWINRFERQCASPGSVRRMLGLALEIDVRDLLGGLRCPVLVMHQLRNQTVVVEHGRHLAAHIPGARYVELDGSYQAPSLGDHERQLALVREFVTSVASAQPDLDQL